MYYLFINFKAYRESTSLSAINLIRAIERNFGNDERVKIVLNPLDSMIESNLDKYIQHADPFPAGPYTGFTPVELLPSYNYKGIMINHSEHRIGKEIILKNVNEARKNGLKSMICAANLNEIKEFSLIKPDFIAYEPPELIGGNISVSDSKPEIILQAFNLLKGNGIELIVGAGVKNGKDVRKSIELGAKGVLVASGIVKSKEPITVIKDMINNLGD